MENFKLRWPATRKLEKVTTLTFDEALAVAKEKMKNPTATAQTIIKNALGEKKLSVHAKKNPSVLLRQIKAQFMRIALKKEPKADYEALVKAKILKSK